MPCNFYVCSDFFVVINTFYMKYIIARMGITHNFYQAEIMVIESKGVDGISPLVGMFELLLH